VSVRGKKTTPKAEAFASKYHDNPRAISEYLNDALSTGDPLLVTKAIGDMVRAQGMTRFSKKAGMRRDNLYRSFGGELRPLFDRVINVLLALDIRLIATPATGLVEIGLSKSAPSERLNAARTSVSAGAGLKAKGK
jgi:probable addiction module antidote protein